MQRWPVEGVALPFMATVEHLNTLFWARLASGVVFLLGLLCYLYSFRQRRGVVGEPVPAV